MTRCSPTYPCLSEDENAAYATSVLERLHADGRLGAYWWCWSDYDEEVLTGADERTYGIIRRDGSEKPVARALSDFARARRTVVKPVRNADDLEHLLLSHAAGEHAHALRCLPELYRRAPRRRCEALSPPADNLFSVASRTRTMEVSEVATQPMPLYHTIVHNCDCHTFQDVIFGLMRIVGTGMRDAERKATEIDFFGSRHRRDDDAGTRRTLCAALT